MMARPRPSTARLVITLGALSEFDIRERLKVAKRDYSVIAATGTRSHFSPDTFWVFLSSCKSSKHHFRQAG